MKQHTSEFKNNLKKMGKQIDSIITYGNTTLHDELYAVSCLFESNILKSIMKKIEIESSIDIPLETIINYKLGVLVNGTYEYLDYGNYVVYKSEKQEDTNTYKITCYDKMVYAMKQNEDLEITYPISIKDYLTAIATKINLEVEDSTFYNETLTIPSELYLGLEYTYRDILDEIAQATGSMICINNNDKIEVKYPTITEDTIDSEQLKDVNVTFGEKYGPINSIVLSRGAESDNVYLQDEESIQKNGLCEIKITENQIMNDNNRSDYLQGILNAVNGLYYYINDFTSTGILYYDPGDIYNVEIDNTQYQCLMLNDEINITTGIEELIHTDLPDESVTNYSKADKTDKRINQAYFMVNKQSRELEALLSEQREQESVMLQIQGNVEGLTTTIASQNAEFESRMNELQQTINGLQQTLTQYGGNNIFYYAKEFWTDGTENEINLPNLEEETNTEIQNISVSKEAYIINTGNSNQKVTVPNNTYAISFTYKKLVELATCKVVINGVETILDSMDWEEKVFVVEVSSNVLEFNLYSDTDNALILFDLMGNVGNEKQIWTQNPNETRTDTVTIGKGVQVESSTTNTFTRIDSDGNRTFNKTTGEVVSEQTDKGTWTQQITANQGSIGGILIQEQDNQTWISSLL